MKSYSSFAYSSIGENHIKKGIVCQDSSLNVTNSRYSFAATADGHGSLCYLRTDRGSEYAVDCAQVFVHVVGSLHLWVLRIWKQKILNSIKQSLSSLTLMKVLTIIIAFLKNVKKKMLLVFAHFIIG